MFSATGLATGPYPGTFTETGTATVTKGLPGQTTSFSANFTITSGTVTVKGTKTFSSSNTGAGCRSGTSTVATSNTNNTYQATITNANGTYSDAGNALSTVSIGGSLNSAAPDPGNTLLLEFFTSTQQTTTLIPPVCTSNCGTNATPELGSGELLATGLLPLGAVLLYRRRRTRRALEQ